MKCPTCGNNASDLAATCAVCATPLRRSAVAAAVLTPPVPGSTSASDAETVAVPAASPFGTTGMPANLASGQTFGHRYQVISLLGVGGMGAVYHVWDTELGLSLALKVIRPETDPSAALELERRFKRELVLARQVTHTNVIRIHDLGEIDGTKYLTMPFIHGSDLSKVLTANGKLPLARALPFARQIVSGLCAAHEVGVVHRDLKPANILIDDAEKAIITDFGIARSVEAGTFATAAGAIIGTIAYMAPEQAMGRPVDQRADIYAFGLILSEMLVGRRGSSGGDTALSLLIERSRQAPPRLRTLDPSIPEPLDAIAARCLEPDPDARYQTTRELEAAIERLDANGNERVAPAVPAAKPSPWLAIVPAGLALAAALIIGTLWMSSRSAPPPPPPSARPPVSVLIADFDNQAKDPLFAESLEQALSIAMEGASFVTSYSRTTAKGLIAARKPGEPLNEENARLVAASEGIGVVLTGAIVAENAGYRINVRAIDPANGNALATAEAPVANKAAVLKGVEAVATALRARFGDTPTEGATRAAAETVTAASLDALQQYSIAQDLSSSGKQEESIPHYRKAIELDQNFGRAYSGLATVLFNLGQRQEATELWERSLKLMEHMTERERYRTLGLWFAGPGGSYEKAIENFEKLVSLYPADRAGQSNLAFSYFQILDFEKAMRHGRAAVDLYPKNPRARMNFAIYATYAGDLKTADAEARTVIKDSKTLYKAYLPLAAVAFANSDYDAMRGAYEAMKTTAPGTSVAVHGLADLAMYEGRWADAEKLLSDGIAADAKTKNTTSQAAKLMMRAELHATLNRMPQALGDAQDALQISKEHSTLLPAALLYIRANRRADAQAIAQELSNQFQRRGRAYGEIVQAELARAAGSYVPATEAFSRAAKLSDLWIGRFLLARTYIDAEQYPLAQAELAIAERRRLEASAVFLDDVPSYRYLSTMPYWTARMQQGTNPQSAAAAESYKKFLALRPDTTAGDAIAADARKRLAR
jgi:serine/threonine protein kinase/tetratricopeptide (TPR) repeat protein